MKFTAIILLSACLAASANGFSQKVTLSEKNARLENVFEVIKSQTGYKFLYTVEQLKKASLITIDLKAVELEDALNVLFKDQPLTYSIIEKTVVIKPKIEEPTKENVPPPPIDVRGRVVNENGEPVAGATVTVKGTKNATSTNANGEFSLKEVDANATLVFSSTNIESVEINLNGRNTVTVTAKNRVGKLDEVQIIGYGTTTQRYNVGSVAKITSEEISRQPVSNPMAALQGRVPGLIVSSTSGIPGSSFKVQLRGQNSLNPTASGVNPFDNPLIIIDGIPLSSSNLNQLSSLGSPGTSTAYNNQYGGISPLNAINPRDIESIEVLKDADATAIYGSRGANGVIIITTKKGQSGKIKVNASVYRGQTRVTRTVELLNLEEYLEMRREAFKNDGITPTVTNAYDLLIFDTTKYTDWTKYYLGKPSTTTDIQTGISGGSSTTSFRFSSNFHRETFMMPGDFSDRRVSFNSSLRHESPDKKYSLELRLLYSYNTTNSASRNEALNGFARIPNWPDLIDAQGNLVWRYNGFQFPLNQMSYLKEPYKGDAYTLNTNMVFTYKLLKNLSLTSIFGYSNTNFEEIGMQPISSQDPAITNRTGKSDFANTSRRTWNIEPRLDYNLIFGEGRLTAMIGTTFQKNMANSSSITGRGYTNDLLLSTPLGASTIEKLGFSNSEYKYSSLIGHINYVHKDRYIINLNGRRDASSKFGPDKRLGNFGAVGGGWIFSEASLIKKLSPVISYGKLRISYGTTGSDAIRDYQFIATWTPASQTYLGSPGYNPNNVYNPDFTWAVTKKLEVGLELGLLKDRILITTNWYKNKTGNQLVTYPLPSQTGFSGVIMNQPAVVENKGWDVSIISKNIKTKNFSWTTNFNLNTAKNVLTSFPGIENTSYATTLIVGQSLSARKLFQVVGIDPLTGVFTYFSKTNGVTSSPFVNDQVLTIDLTPKYTGNFTNSFNYKSFSLDFSAEFRKQIGQNYLTSIYGNPVGGVFFNYPKEVMRRWQKPGDVSDIQRFTSLSSGLASDAARSIAGSDRAFSDASFIRIRNISVSYNITKDLLRGIKWADMTIYIQAQNCFTITRYKGHDPETQTYLGVPPAKTIVAGLNINL